MKPVIGAMLAVLATCEDRIVVGDMPDGGADAGEVDAGPMCPGGCYSAGVCTALASNTTSACGSDAGVCSDCSSTVLHASLATCTSGACDFLACETGWSDCDGVRGNGCERHVSSCYELVFSDQPGGWQLESDGVDLYWVVSGGIIRKAAADGGAAVDIATGAYDQFLLDGSNIFLATDTTLSVMPKAGGPAVVLVTAPGRFRWLTTDGSTLFWVSDMQNGQWQIRAVAVSGGQDMALLSGVQTYIQVLTIIDDDLWFLVGHEIMKLPKTGGVLTRLAVLPADLLEEGRQAAMVMTRDIVYWGVVTREDPVTRALEGAIFSMPYATGTPTRLLDIPSAPIRLVLDGTDLFVTANSSGVAIDQGLVARVPLAGGSPSVIVASVAPRAGPAIIGNSVFWSDRWVVARILKTARDL